MNELRPGKPNLSTNAVWLDTITPDVPASGHAPCCGGEPEPGGYVSDQDWTIGRVSTTVGDVSIVSTKLTLSDRMGHWRVRWSIGRMRFAIRPGLYAVGNPTAESSVFVTANYKQSFDRLRVELVGRDGWIMVLDTKGINVWCAAGKGTFGTDEIINRLRATRLSEVVSHHKLIVPQLGAPGVKGYKVKKQTGFTVRYGPVRADDLPAFLDGGRKATPQMRLVRFEFGDRLVLVPVELVGYGRYVLLITLGLALLSGFGSGIYSLERVWSHGLRAAIPFLGGTLAGAVFAPMLLPWLPGRSFSAKGAWAGVLYLLILGGVILWRPEMAPNWADILAWLLLVPALASFVAMNFTGSSTYTSLSGVRKEMRRWVRIQAVAFVVGLGLWFAARFV